MPLVDGRSIALPYGIEIRDRSVRVFNREYGVLAGFNLQQRPAHSTLVAMSHDGKEVGTTDGAIKIFFYGDACIPFQEALRRLLTESPLDLGQRGRFRRSGSCGSPKAENQPAALIEGGPLGVTGAVHFIEGGV